MWQDTWGGGLAAPFLFALFILNAVARKLSAQSRARLADTGFGVDSLPLLLPVVQAELPTRLKETDGPGLIVGHARHRYPINPR